MNQKNKNQGKSTKNSHNNDSHENHNHNDHHQHMLQDFRKRFWGSLVLTLPVLALSPMIQSVTGLSLTFPGDRILLFILSTAVFIYGGKPFLSGLVDEIRKRRPGMMLLIGLAVGVAYAYSTLVTFVLPGKLFFWELVTLIDVMLLGHWIEMRSVMGASMALENLARLMPSTAHRLIDEEGKTEDIPVQQLEKHDRILVKPGEKIPADGTITDGESEINESMITGESEPVSRKPDDSVVGGSVNGNNAVTVRIEKTGSDSYLSQMIDMVKSAQQSKSRSQTMADRAALWLTVIAISAGILTIIIWLLIGNPFSFALERMVTVMVITCPHALGLAVPLVIAMVTSVAAGRGLLIRERTPFEEAWRIDTVVFDKTGTLTRGEFGVTNVVSTSGWDEQKVLQAAASAETGSEHTLAQGIVKYGKEQELKFLTVTDTEAVPGKGVRAETRELDESVYVGNRRLISSLDIEIGENLQKDVEKMTAHGKTVVYVAVDGEIKGWLALADIIREESYEAVRNIRKKGFQTAMITGDKKETAEYVAAELGLDTFYAEILPDKKEQKIREMQDSGRRVAMVGDGINDAPALARADLGIAIGTGTDIAVESADMVLVKSDPNAIGDIFRLSRLTQRKMLQNLAWATGYNVAAIPLAAGVLAGYGILLPPAAGAVVMSVSTVIVAVNARMVNLVKSDE